MIDRCDLRKKKEVYGRAGVKEYWIVDPDMKSVEVHVNEEGKFRLIQELRRKGIIRSKIIEGLSIPLDNILP